MNAIKEKNGRREEIIICLKKYNVRFGQNINITA